MPGYMLLDLDHSSIAAKYLCLFCDCLLRDPVQTACGHCYCRSCIDNLLLKNQYGKFQMQCPSCGDMLPQDQVFPDNFMKREVLALKVHCPHENEGCSWKGEIRELEAHTSVCDLVQVFCPYTTCGMMTRKSDLVKHLQSECPCRLVTCNYCGTEINGNVLEMNILERGRGSVCPDSCVTEVHSVPRQCTDIGEARCSGPMNTNGPRVFHQQQAHSNVPSVNMQNTMNAIYHEVFDDVRRKDHFQETTRVNNLSAHQQQQQNVYQQVVPTLEHAVEERYGRRIDESRRKVEEFVRDQEASSYDGVLHWKITDFARKRSDAVSGKQTSFFSPCFYTDGQGYKMCARIYLNGDEGNQGSHISLSFMIMRGPFDAQLPWPFNHEVTINLMNEDNMGNAIHIFRPDPNTSSFQKPREEINTASRCPLFLPLSKSEQGFYVRDDTMIIKVIVNLSNNALV